MQKKTAILTNEKTSITTAHSSGANNLAIMNVLNILNAKIKYTANKL